MHSSRLPSWRMVAFIPASRLQWNDQPSKDRRRREHKSKYSRGLLFAIGIHIQIIHLRISQLSGFYSLEPHKRPSKLTLLSCLGSGAE